MQKPLLLILAIWLLATTATAQVPTGSAPPERDLRATASSFAYYITLDGKRVSGLHIAPIEPDLLLVLEQPSHERKTFLPGDILEYGLESGERYLSAEITFEGLIHKVFLESVIEEEDYQVLTYQQGRYKLFYLHKDGVLTPINDNGVELRKLMRAEALRNQCQAVNEIDQHPMKLTKSSLTNIYDAYRLCNTKLIRRPVRWGLGVGFDLNWLNIQWSDWKYKTSFSVSPFAFIDIPLDSHFSLVGELHYRSVSFRNSNLDHRFDREIGTLSFKRHSLYIPIAARYTMTHLRGRIMPYFEAGATADLLVGGGCEVRPKETMSPSMWGAVVGAGTEIRMSYRHSFFFSLRFNYLITKTQDGFYNKERIQFISLNAGYSF